MSGLFWLSEAQMARLRPFFPKSRGNRRVRWSRKGIFARILIELAREGDKTDTLMIGRTKGGLNSTLHAITDALGCLIRMFLSAGNVSDYNGARALLPSLPSAK